LSKIKAFRCFHKFQVAVANTSKKKGFLKIPRAVSIISERLNWMELDVNAVMANRYCRLRVYVS
jgi:hypothetical protein